LKTLIHITHNDDLYEVVFSDHTLHRITKFTNHEQAGTNLKFADLHPGVQVKVIAELKRYVKN
jgi:hypothetical protein